MPSSRRSPQPRDQTQVFHIAGGFYLPSKSPGNPKNPGVECHFPLQGIFPTKRSNQHLLCLLNWQAVALSLAPPVKHLVHKVYLCITFYLFIYLFWPHHSAYRIFLNQGLNPHPLHWEHRVLTTGPPGKLHWLSWSFLLWKILKEMRITDHLTCLLRNLKEGQEATVRTRHGTMDWFQIGKGICQVCILSPCLFNLYEEYIMWNAGLYEEQAGIKIAGRSINNLRYTDNTILMAEKGEQKSLLMKVKEESEKAGLNSTLKKTKIMASSPITSW